MKKQKGKTRPTKIKPEGAPPGDIMVPVNNYWRNKLNEDFGPGTADFFNYVGGSYYHTWHEPFPIPILFLLEMRKFFQELGENLEGKEAVRGIKIASMLMDVKLGVDFGFGSSNQGVGTC